MDRPRRRLNLADLALLVVAAAAGLVLLRAFREGQLLATIDAGDSYRGTVLAMHVAPFLITGSAALLVARATGTGRRPVSRYRFRRPGTIACATFLASLAFALSTLGGRRLIDQLLGRPHRFGIDFVDQVLIYSLQGGDEIAFVWLALALTGRWRPEGDWIDRAGRVLGLVAILITVAIRLYP